jgi:hypothetical protein
MELYGVAARMVYAKAPQRQASHPRKVKPLNSRHNAGFKTFCFASRIFLL